MRERAESLLYRGETGMEKQIRELQRAVLKLSETRAPDFCADWSGYAEAIEAIRKRVEGARKAVNSPDL